MSGDIEELKHIVDKIEMNELTRPAYENLTTSIILGLFYALASQDKEIRAYYWNKFKEVFLSYPTRLEINITPSMASMDFSLNSARSLYPSTIADILRKSKEQAQVRKRWLPEFEAIGNYLAILDELLEIMLSWSKGTVTFTEYLMMRKDVSKELKENLRVLSGHSSTMVDSIERKPIVNREVIEAEKREIDRILIKYDTALI
jgi:hypothetical protein